MPRHDPRKTPSDTLRKLQSIAKRTPNQTPPVDGISGSAEELASELQRYHSMILLSASRYGIQPSDILDEIRRRISG